MDKTKKMIIIADDDPDCRKGSRDILEADHVDCEFLLAANGDEALKLLRENLGNVALVLTDNSMPPGMGGIDLSTAIHRMGLKIPIIMISGVFVTAEFSAKLVEAGVTAFFLKPPDFPLLIEKVKTLLQE